ncbi:DUF4265 domain-containing protein [Nocardioides KLBMP 9356]|uniref:DUF4265 domain-containing protein n=1 Tax=Nocardioides potassii TaxID=2911371 RepID=A0ABS9H5C1_9ACTN|nr:DUF4265 domain-containing protein [Nocardioides potassii]MCF6376451.1 DUF4265 domain-containing protein [Nocardioides potassii]
MSRIEVVHRHPAWRDRSNFIIAANIDPGSTGVTTEQLWARQDGDRYEICCIPFFVYDLALGDVVEVDGDHVMTQVVEKSGRYVFRVHFGQTDQPRDEVVERLQAMGAIPEWSSRSLVAVDARDESHAQEVADFLQEQEDGGHLIYETGRR